MVALLSPAHLRAQAASVQTPCPPMRLPGLHGPACVTRDGFGIPHIHAIDLHDLLFLQGWVHAQDRLFQMDVRRRQASGTLAELLGAQALPSDVRMRTFGLRRAAERSLSVLSVRARAGLQAYAEGVNAYVARNPLPPEYAELRLTRFEPWTPVDSIAYLKLLLFFLSFELDIEDTVTLMAYQQAGLERGFNGTALYFQDVHRVQPFTPVSTVPDSGAPVPWRPLPSALETNAVAARLDPAVLRLARQYHEQGSAIPRLQEVEAELRAMGNLGSNEWVVSGRYTATGRPLFANDPHLPTEAPSAIYPIHLRSPSLDVAGGGFAGLPLVSFGHNRHVSWGITHNPTDVTDTFSERVVRDANSPSGLSTLYLGRREPVLALREVFRANQRGGGLDDIAVVPPGAGVPEFIYLVPRRDNGPLLTFDVEAGVGLSVQYTGFGATRDIEAAFHTAEARNLEEFRRALLYFDTGSSNLAYADLEGHIAYITTGEIPLREDLQAGYVAGLPPFFIRNGTGGNEWLAVRNPRPVQSIPHEILPAEELPQAIDPPAGWFANANNDPVALTLDNDPLNQLRPGGGLYYLSASYNRFRAGRITQVLRAQVAAGHVSLGDMKALQADTVLLDAQFFTPALVRALASGQHSGEPLLRELARRPDVVEAVGRLARWDFTTPTGIPEGYDASDVDGLRVAPTRAEVEASIAATLYSVWRGQLVREVIDRTLVANGIAREADGSRALVAVRHLLETFDGRGGVGASGLDFFARPGVVSAEARRDVALLSAMARALEFLRGPDFAPAFGGSARQEDYRWGLLHRVLFNHPLGPPYSIPPAGGAFPPPLEGLPGIPMDGGFETVDQSTHVVRGESAQAFMTFFVPGQRLVADLSRRRVSAHYSLSGGVSGVPGDPRSVELLPRWLTNDYIPLLTQPEELLRNIRRVDCFVP
ncbi:penicillin acylase family protein [Cystobacter fuscus]|uniref:penicillin acylase family protein n=1 Tax=Cystobacter fuscus TaxID=43 RepID=UPI0037BFC0F9